MKTTNRNYKIIHTYYPGMYAVEVLTDINRENVEERKRNNKLQPYSISGKCICYIDGLKRVLELVELIRNKERTKDGKLPVITKSILKDIIRYVEFINNIIGEETPQITNFLSNLIGKKEFSVEDMNMLASIANKNIALLEQIMEKEEIEKEGKLK